MSTRPTCRLASPIGSVRVQAPAGEDREGPDPSRPDARAEQLARQLESELAEVAQARGALAAGAAGLAEAEGRLVRQAEGQVLELAMEIAAKVLSQEIRTERHEIEPIVGEALSRVPTRRDVVIRLHPDDLARCEGAGEAEPGGEGDVRFVADVAVGRGGCVIETAEGVVESTVEGNLGRLGDALRAPE